MKRMTTAPSPRRWDHGHGRRRKILCDATAWALFTLVVGAILIVACVLLTLGAPA